MKVSRRLFVSAAATAGLTLFANRHVVAKSAELLEFRLPKAKTVHLHDEKMVKSYEKSFKTLGVQCKLHNHDGHFDLTFECAKWKQAEFGTHAEVEKWEKWLKALGFETKHGD
jgi:hypothetical protein